MKRILLLGGSAQQVIAIKTAKELGYYTVLCDYLADNPGQQFADKYYNISTTDVQAVYEIAKKENVGGILAYASDPAALPAAIVCEKLGLPTNPVSSVEILGVKHKFRKFLEENNFVCPKNFVFKSSESLKIIKENINHFDFPIIIKPTDSSGSKGVTKLYNLENLEKAIEHAKEYSRNQIIIAEEFIERGFPFVIGGDIFVWDGKIELFGEMSCLRSNNGNGLIPIGKKKPSCLNSIQIKLVHEELQKIVTALNIRFGELNIEILLDKNDNVHFLELGPRAGGNMIPIQLSDAYGVDLVKANILAAMGENPKLELSENKECFVTYVVHSFSEGKFKDIKYSSDVEQYIYRKNMYKLPGDKIEFFDGAGKAVGIVFLRFPSIKVMESLTEKLEELIIVELE